MVLVNAPAILPENSIAAPVGTVRLRQAIMPITKKSCDESLELFVAGRIDGTASNELEIALLEAIRSGAKVIYVNLSEATFLCSAGLRVLLQYWRQMKNGGKKLWVANPSPEVDAVLTMTGFRAQMVEGAQPGPA